MINLSPASGNGCSLASFVLLKFIPHSLFLFPFLLFICLINLIITASCFVSCAHETHKRVLRFLLTRCRADSIRSIDEEELTSTTLLMLALIWTLTCTVLSLCWKMRRTSRRRRATAGDDESQQEIKRHSRRWSVTAGDEAAQQEMLRLKNNVPDPGKKW